jgi:hypothetical protein
MPGTAKRLFIHIDLFDSYKNLEVDSTIISLLQILKQKQRKVK